MGAYRVTQQMLVDRVLGNITSQSRTILELQEKLSTGLAVNRPSDDPLALRRGISARSEISKNEQYLSTISTTSPYLLETESTLDALINVYQRVDELTIQGLSDTNGQLQRDEIAEEINQLLEEVYEYSNHMTNGRYIFGGTVTQNEPFEATRNADGEITQVTYVGNDEKVLVEIQEGTTVAINENGENIFSQTIAGTTDVFQLLIDIRDNLRVSDVQALDTNLGELELAQDQVLIATARIGSTQSRINRVQENLESFNVQFEQVYSDNIDADFAELILELEAESNAFQASLDAGGRVIQPSLLQYIS